MKINRFYTLLLVLLMATWAGNVSAKSWFRDQLTGGFVIRLKTFKADSTRIWQDPQDTSKKKVKEVAPAKRQPKPERVEEPVMGRPPIMGRPGFPGGSPQPDRGGSMQPGNNRPQGGGRPQQGPPGAGPRGGSPF